MIFNGTNLRNINDVRTEANDVVNIFAASWIDSSKYPLHRDIYKNYEDINDITNIFKKERKIVQEGIYFTDKKFIEIERKEANIAKIKEEMELKILERENEQKNAEKVKIRKLINAKVEKREGFILNEITELNTKINNMDAKVADSSTKIEELTKIINEMANHKYFSL